MSLIRDFSTFIWLLLFYIFAQYASIYLDMPALNMKYIIWAENQNFYISKKF